LQPEKAYKKIDYMKIHLKVIHTDNQTDNLLLVLCKVCFGEMIFEA